MLDKGDVQSGAREQAGADGGDHLIDSIAVNVPRAINGCGVPLTLGAAAHQI